MVCKWSLLKLPNDVILVRYTLLLRADGQYETKVDHLPIEEVRKQVELTKDEWPEGLLLPIAVEYVVKQLQDIDANLEKELRSI